MTSGATFVCLDGHLHGSWKPRPFCRVLAHVVLARTSVGPTVLEVWSDIRSESQIFYGEHWSAVYFFVPFFC